MSYLLDTNVVSEIVKRNPAPSVMQWLEKIPNDLIYISVLTIGEIRKGIEKIPDKKRKEKIKLWLEIELEQWLRDRILSINVDVAERWGRLYHEMNRPIPIIDSLLAATALHYDLKIATRNEQDFQYPAIEVINPWSMT